MLYLLYFPLPATQHTEVIFDAFIFPEQCPVHYTHRLARTTLNLLNEILELALNCEGPPQHLTVLDVVSSDPTSPFYLPPKIYLGNF